MAKTVTAVAARQSLGELLNRVALANEEIIIERAGKKVARLVSCEEKIVSASGKLDFRTSAGLGRELWNTVEGEEHINTERKTWG
jgi:antitoxin (DNA-binding transcriptional repressor) of toxin-antitoxin stability system